MCTDFWRNLLPSSDKSQKTIIDRKKIFNVFGACFDYSSEMNAVRFSETSVNVLLVLLLAKLSVLP
jgi:hypothetical protein